MTVSTHLALAGTAAERSALGGEYTLPISDVNIRARCPIQQPSVASSTSCIRSTLRGRFQHDVVAFDAVCGCHNSLASLDDVLHAARPRVPAQFGEVQDVIDSFHQRRTTRLDGLQERRLAVVKMRLGQQFRGGKNLTKRA